MKILIVEDNTQLLEAIRETLVGEHYVCETAEKYTAASEKIHMHNYDVMVVDINLPGGSGLKLIREIKGINPATGIIIISARNSLDHKIEGLELGADDYLTKPFDMAELVVRVKALLRRRSFSGTSTVTFGDISIDTGRREVTAGGTKVDLTKSEYNILLFFFSNPNRVLTRESIAEHIWGDNMDLADSFDFIYSHIRNLRKKLTATGVDDPIKVVYGIGYRLKRDYN
ncbi:MAG: response regulator transcription factor [Phaeodactylibacter sp.]|nr:response regulator transcription factor [Sinomicrobium sp.]MCB0578300.1 response regulator transcription factor [Phaeodactylibacter sp.]MCB9293288.1 response regulator transcription factor [Lewinellaceae bacterium]